MDREPTELEITVAAPFRHMRKTELAYMSLIFYYTQDKKWLSLEQVKKLLPLAESCGILMRNGDNYQPAEYLTEIKIIQGFRPTDAIFTEKLPEQADTIESLLEAVAKKTGKEKTELMQETEDIKKHFDGMLYTEAAIVVLAKKYGISTEKYQPSLLRQITE